MNSLNHHGLIASLITAGLLASNKHQQIIRAASVANCSLVSYLVENDFIDSLTLATFCEIEYHIPLVDADTLDIDNIPDTFIRHELIEKHHALPLYIKQKTLYIALSDPTNITALDDFSFIFGVRTEALLVEENKLSKMIESLLSDGLHILNNSRDIDLIEIDESLSRLDETQAMDDDTPVVKYINGILMDAIKKGASDLHFEPYEKTYRIRFRVDGMLYEVASPPVNLTNRFSARLKVMSKLDIAERRLPQDGRIKLNLANHHHVDMRVSTLPTMWGEKVVMRILDASNTHLDIDTLGFNHEQKMRYQQALQKPQGLILITGPTGSGKTVSLYSGLSLLNTIERNISTAEDPIELSLSGINQVQINNKTGLTFATALRSFLRQDPDVVMVGEIRDLETAEIAIKAAQTGHLVLSTLHTNSAADTLNRLLNMGIPAFNLAASVSLIIAQRLARCLCEHCKTVLTITDHELLEIGFNQQQLSEKQQLCKPVGCHQCTEGYKGRIGLYEVMAMSPQLEAVILNQGNSMQITETAICEGMLTLRQSAILLALKGTISVNEVTRVT